jgi:hypothetical protein
MSTFSSSKSKRDRIVSQFMSFTQANEKSAINFLNQHDWKLDMALDAYYLSLDSSSSSSGAGGLRRDSIRSSQTSAVDRKKLDQIWNLYRGES